MADAVIAASISEHWYNVLRGTERWNQTAYFYPAPDTLGYNDGYFLNGALAAIVRGLGADPFLALEFANAMLRAAGFVAFCAFATDVMGLALPCALLGAVVVTLANNITVQSNHVQLFTQGLAPLLGWLIWRAATATRARADRAAIAWGGAAAALFGAWLMTAFYTAWFTAAFMALALLAALASGTTRRALAPVARWPLLASAVLAIAAAIPFLLVYLPKVRETGGHGYLGSLPYLPTLFDLVRLGPGNVLFGGLDQAVADAFRGGMTEGGEHVVGMPPVLLACAAAGGLLAAWPRRGETRFWGVLAVSILLSLALCVRVGGVSLWRFVHDSVPGAAGVRVIARNILFLTLPVTLLAMYALQRLTVRWPLVLVAPLALVLVAEEITTGIPVGLQRKVMMAEMDAIGPPPTACVLFYAAVPAARPGMGSALLDGLYGHNVDAMLAAELRGIPTINGFSTFNPPGWDFADPLAPDYTVRVNRYLAAHHIDGGVCSLDLARGAWNGPLQQ